MPYGVLVVWKNGRQAYMERHPSGERMEFRKKRDAEEAAELLRIGIVPDEAQSVNVVRLDQLEALGMGRTRSGVGP